MIPTIYDVMFGGFIYLFFFCCWLHHTACEILAPQPGIEPGSSAVRMWSPNQRTSREFPQLHDILEKAKLWEQ